MFAARNHNQSKEPPGAKPKSADLGSNRKAAPKPNALWQSLAMRPRAIQAKLAISQPDDPYEQEADRVADRVMRGATSQITNSTLSLSSSGSLRAQRKCAPCEEEEEKEKLQRKEQSASPGSQGVDPQVVHQALDSPGQPLDSTTRAFFEPRFGRDFSKVRVHDDPQAAASADAINATAYTLGSDIVFRAGAFAPKTAGGQHLLGHELAHVVQQGSAERPPMIFRQSHDFDIRGKFEDSASFTELVFFKEGSSSLDLAETTKIDAFALPASDLLVLNGFASEEDSAAANLARVNSRLDVVAARLIAKGHDAAKITKTPLPSSGKGRIDYRRMRSVEIVKPGGASSVPGAAVPATAPCAGSNETDFKDAEGEAEAMIAKAITALGTVPIPAGMTALLTRFFPAWAPADAAKIKSNLSDIKTQLARLLPAANHQCAIIKFAACEAGAEAQNTRTGAAAMMTMCPTFFAAGKSKKDRGGTLLHEASHGTPGLVSKDRAYAHERRIEFLGLAEALINSDSYKLLVRLFDVPGSVTVGPATPDPLSGGIVPGSAEDKAARRTIAWMEKWLVLSYQEMSSLYNTIHASLAAGVWTNSYYQDTMGLVAPLFGLTAPPALPTKADKVKVAAIHDRFHIMRFTEKGTAITLNKIPVGTDKWAPGPGTSVDLSPAFFADTARGQLDRMLTAIATATPDVSLALVPKYVTLADKIRTHMGEGGP